MIKKALWGKISSSWAITSTKLSCLLPTRQNITYLISLKWGSLEFLKTKNSWISYRVTRTCIISKETFSVTTFNLFFRFLSRWNGLTFFFFSQLAFLFLLPDKRIRPHTQFCFSVFLERFLLNLLIFCYVKPFHLLKLYCTSKRGRRGLETMVRKQFSVSKS